MDENTLSDFLQRMEKTMQDQIKQQGIPLTLHVELGTDTARRTGHDTETPAEQTRKKEEEEDEKKKKKKNL
nr:hypothetical protein BaRGS_003079 [Batillaria attramentaria]